MDGDRFDGLARAVGRGATRRAVVGGLLAGLLGLRAARPAAAEVTAAGCRPQACRKATLRQSCLDARGNPDNHRCCQGLKCSNTRGDCVFKNGHGGAGDYCRTSNDCDQRFFCKKNQCLPNSCQG